jgi:hypothetical protein
MGRYLQLKILVLLRGMDYIPTVSAFQDAVDFPSEHLRDWILVPLIEFFSHLIETVIQKLACVINLSAEASS